VKVVVAAYTLPGKLRAGDTVLLLGEIENMPGHVAVVDEFGKVHWALHEDSFREPTEDEL
jgi:hypothetical protein